MPRLERERAAKLALLEALAASQRAVARMLESTADLHERFPGEKPEEAAAMLSRLAALQLRMCETLLGLKLRRVSRGRPAGPWLADGRLRARIGEGAFAWSGLPAVAPDAPSELARRRMPRRGNGDARVPRGDDGMRALSAAVKTRRREAADSGMTDRGEPE